MKTRAYVYILASHPYGTLYVGVTTDLVRRIHQHRNEVFADCFTKLYGVKTLVWYENYASGAAALRREKQLKKWERRWKIRLINTLNPDWRDLSDDICEL